MTHVEGTNGDRGAEEPTAVALWSIEDLVEYYAGNAADPSDELREIIACNVDISDVIDAVLSARDWSVEDRAFIEDELLDWYDAATYPEDGADA